MQLPNRPPACRLLSAPVRPSRRSGRLPSTTGHKFTLIFEQRVRYEDRTGNSFGKDVDVATGLFRTRLGLTYTPVPWLKFTGVVQDCRAPWYGPGAPNSHAR